MKILWDPFDTFAKIGSGSQWWRYLLMLSAGYLVLNLAAVPFLHRAASLLLGSVADPAEAERAFERGILLAAAGLAFIPLVQLAKASFYALLALGFGALVNLRIGFRPMLSVLLACSLVFLVQGAFCLFLLVWRGREAIGSPSDLEISTGLNLLFEASSPFWNAVLTYINPFELWFLALLIAGISAISEPKCSPDKTVLRTCSELRGGDSGETSPSRPPLGTAATALGPFSPRQLVRALPIALTVWLTGLFVAARLQEYAGTLKELFD